MNKPLTPTLSPFWRGEGEKAAAMSPSAQRQFRGQHNFAGDARGGLRLNQIAEPADDVRFELDDFAGFGGAENFHVSQRGQLQIFSGGIFGSLCATTPASCAAASTINTPGKIGSPGKCPRRNGSSRTVNSPSPLSPGFNLVSRSTNRNSAPCGRRFKALTRSFIIFGGPRHSVRAFRLMSGSGAHGVASPTALMVQRF